MLDVLVEFGWTVVAVVVLSGTVFGVVVSVAALGSGLAWVTATSGGTTTSSGTYDLGWDVDLGWDNRLR